MKYILTSLCFSSHSQFYIFYVGLKQTLCSYASYSAAI
jgi:hypothetical protein